MQIVIADGLTRGMLSPEKQFLGIRRNLGGREIARLMGSGRAFGKGPIPSFIRLLTEAGPEGPRLILIQEVAAEDGEGGENSELEGVMREWVEPIEALEPAEPLEFEPEALEPPSDQDANIDESLDSLLSSI